MYLSVHKCAKFSALQKRIYKREEMDPRVSLCGSSPGNTNTLRYFRGGGLIMKKHIFEITRNPVFLGSFDKGSHKVRRSMCSSGKRLT